MSETSLPEELIFGQAVEIDCAAERAAFLDRTCGDNHVLRAAVEALLHASERSGDLLDLPEKPAATVDEPAVTERPGMVIGPYKLLQEIGEGGFGTVFMAEQTHPVQRKVALKVIKAGMDSKQVIARFEAERQALAMMDHVNIARVLDAGATEAGRPYFVMELVHGVPITKYCDDNRLTPRERLELFVPVCQAIQHAHQKGIIHRDIKPSNVMITLYDGKPVPKVIDFGVAKATEQRLTERTLFTQYGTMVGTFEYMSPEQAEMSALGADTRSDIFSLGVLLYELLTGSTPLSHKRFKEAAFGEILRMIKEEEAPKPSTRLSDSGEALASISAQRHMEPAKLTKLVRGELDWIVMKCLEKDRNRRYDTANGFAQDIERYLNDEAVQACPPSAGYRLTKFARRNKVALTTAVVVATAMILALVVLSISNVWVMSERDQKANALREKQEALEKETAALAKAREQEELAKSNAALAQQQQSIATAEATRAKEQELLARRRFYATQISLAQGAWEQGRPARVLELLESQRPKFDEPDLRTFEWYHLWRRCHADCRLNFHIGHPPEFSSVAISPDGKTLAAQWDDSEIKLWDVASGRERLTLKKRRGTVWSLAFAPDGQTLAIGGLGPGNLIIWDFTTGTTKKTLESGQKELRSLAFASDGRKLACGSEDGTVKLWNVETWSEENTLHGHTGPVLCVTFSPNSKMLASASGWGREGGLVNLWDLSAKIAKSRHRLDNAATIAFSPDGNTLALGRHGEVRLWDVATGHKLASQYNCSDQIYSVAYSPDGRTVAIGHGNRSVNLWEPATGQEHSYAHHDTVNLVAFSPDGKTVASASVLEGAAKLWNVIPVQEPATIQTSGYVGALAYSPDGQILAMGDGSSTKLWDLATGRLLARLSIPGIASFSHDGKTLAIGSSRAVELIAVTRVQGQGAIQVQTSSVGSLPFDTDNPLEANLDCGSLAFGENDKTLAMAGSNVSARVWDLETRQVRIKLDGVSVAFSPDCKILATGGGSLAGEGNGTVALWDVNTFKERITCKGERSSWAYRLQFSPDGRLIAQATEYGTILIWDAATGALRASMKGHTNPVTCVAFHPDGKTLASGSKDKTIKLWDVATGQERLTLACPTGHVLYVAFAPDGNTLASGSSDGHVRLWKAATDSEALARRTELERNEPATPMTMIHQGDGLRDSARLDAAAKAYSQAEARLSKLAAAFAKDRAQESWPLADYRSLLTRSQVNLAASLAVYGQGKEADDAYQKLLELSRISPAECNNFAWLLATFQDPKLRNPKWAVKLAKKAVEMAPDHGEFWNTLGVAHYRAGDWNAATTALKKSNELVRDGTRSFNACFLAMAQWQLGNKDEARKWYYEPVEWSAINSVTIPEFRRFRAEAEELLGIK